MAGMVYSGHIISSGLYIRLIRQAWYTVDLFYHRALIFASYDMPGIQWTYSIIGPLYSPHTTCLVYSGPILSSGPYIRLIRHAWYTVGIFYHRALIFASYDMPGIQWTYSIIGPLYSPHTTCLVYSRHILSSGPYIRLIRHAWYTVDLFYLQALGRPI